MIVVYLGRTKELLWIRNLNRFVSILRRVLSVLVQDLDQPLLQVVVALPIGHVVD